MATVAPGVRASGSPDWLRRYPALAFFALAVIVAVSVLPSSLNLPQTNPTATLEYAPVPPSDEEQAVQGNVNEFGLGQSGSLETGGALGGNNEGLPPPPPSQGKTPSTKNCQVDDLGVVRQTADPLSPPCVPDYRTCADNAGATYQGVTGNEIKILIYFDSGIVDSGTSQGDETRPSNKYFDLFSEVDPNGEHVYVRLLRGWQRYFDDRYQLYCRHAHFFVYFGSRSDAGPEAKRADAADNYDRIKPFAIVTDSLASNDAYLDAMARRGVLNFGSFIGRSNAFFLQHPKYIWGYSPTIETQASQYSSFVCKKIAPYPTSFAGPSPGNGKKRKYGLVYTTDPNRPELKTLKDLVVGNVKRECGVTISHEATWQPCCFAEDNSTLPTYANNGMARFADPLQAGGPVTTILWPGGMESKFGDAAVQRGYLPEWILLGDGETDGFVASQYQNPAAFGTHAWVVSYQTRKVAYEQEACFIAYKDADPSAPNTDVRGRACSLYDRLRQLFIGIQASGPRLGPASIDKGYHAIPKIASRNPGIPACFYNLNDYTCVKDMVAMWWDANATAPNASRQGCWKNIAGGRRFLTPNWPSGDIAADRNAETDGCNGYGGQALTFLSPRTP